MIVRLIAAGTRLPSWVNDGYQTYAKRLGGECRLELIEIPLGRRGKNADVARAVADEGGRMLARVQSGDYVIALDVGGRVLSTEALAEWLDQWFAAGRHCSVLIGGPDGLADACRKRADLTLSLSAMTLPHGLVRVLFAEQLYRAHSLLRGHPYHRT